MDKIDMDSYRKGVEDAWFAIGCSLQCWGMGGDSRLDYDARQPIWDEFSKDFQMQVAYLLEEGPLDLK